MKWSWKIGEFAGLVGNPMLLCIAFFAWIGAAQESSAVQMESALSGIPVARAMLTDFRTLQPHESLDQAAELILAGSHQDVPVVDSDRVAGVQAPDYCGVMISNGMAGSVPIGARRRAAGAC